MKVIRENTIKEGYEEQWLQLQVYDDSGEPTIHKFDVKGSVDDTLNKEVLPFANKEYKGKKFEVLHIYNNDDTFDEDVIYSTVNESRKLRRKPIKESSGVLGQLIDELYTCRTIEDLVNFCDDNEIYNVPGFDSLVALYWGTVKTDIEEMLEESDELTDFASLFNNKYGDVKDCRDGDIVRINGYGNYEYPGGDLDRYFDAVEDELRRKFK